MWLLVMSGNRLLRVIDRKDRVFKMSSQQLGIEAKNASKYARISLTDLLTYNITGCVWIII